MKGVELKLNRSLPLVAIEKYKKEADLSTHFPEIDATPEVSLESVEIRSRGSDNWQMGISVNVAVNDGKGNVGHTKVGIGVCTVDKKEMRFPKFKAWFSVIFSTHLFTEYFLPFILAIATISSKIWLVINYAIYA